MDLKEICEKAEQEHQLTQTELARKIGLQPSALSHVMSRRRKLPAEAAIELSELTGMRAKEVWQAAQNWAKKGGMHVALAALSFVVLYLTGETESAVMSMGWVVGSLQPTNYGDYGSDCREGAGPWVDPIRLYQAQQSATDFSHGAPGSGSPSALVTSRFHQSSITSVRAGLVSVTLTTGLFAGLGYLLWLDQQQAPLPELPRAWVVPSPAPAVTLAPDGLQRNPEAGAAAKPDPAAGLFKCIQGGRTIYQDHPCSPGTARQLDRGTLSVVSPPSVTLRPVVPESGGPAVAMIERNTPQVFDPEPCPALRDTIRHIDARARVRSTENLTEQRRRVRRRMYELRCPDIDPDLHR